MEWTEQIGKWKVSILKYKYFLFILLLGVFLMTLPSPKQPMQPQPQTTQQRETVSPQSLQEQLESILGQISGAGKVRVLLTQASGEERIYQKNESFLSDETSNNARGDTVILTDGNRGQSGLIRQINPPVYQGAIVVCQGGDKAAVRLAIVEAVSNVTGITSNRITVLKMK